MYRLLDGGDIMIKSDQMYINDNWCALACNDIGQMYTSTMRPVRRLIPRVGGTKNCENCGHRENEEDRYANCHSWPECSLTYDKWRPRSDADDTHTGH